jgi:hypothetical protein
MIPADIKFTDAPSNSFMILKKAGKTFLSASLL